MIIRNLRIKDIPKENNYVEVNDKSDANISKTESMFNPLSKGKTQLLSQSLFQLLFCPSIEFKRLKSKAFNLLSYDKLIHNVVELSELKDYLINEMELVYSGNCKLNYFET